MIFLYTYLFRLQTDRSWSRLQKSSSIFLFGSLRGQHEKNQISQTCLLSGPHANMSLFSQADLLSGPHTNFLSLPLSFSSYSLQIFHRIPPFHFIHSSLSLSSSPLLLLLLLLPSECTARWRWLAWHCRRGDSQEQAGGGTATSGRRLGFGQLGSARYGQIHAVPAAVDEEEEEIVGSGPATILSATAATAGSAASAATHSRQLDPCSHLQ